MFSCVCKINGFTNLCHNSKYAESKPLVNVSKPSKLGVTRNSEDLLNMIFIILYHIIIVSFMTHKNNHNLNKYNCIYNIMNARVNYISIHILIIYIFYHKYMVSFLGHIINHNYND